MPSARFTISAGGALRKISKFRKLSELFNEALEGQAEDAVTDIRASIDNDDTSFSHIARRAGGIYRNVDYRIHNNRGIVRAEIGVLSGGTKVQQQSYTQEFGNTIRAVRAQKLAFPPTDVGSPIRGVRGEQLLTVRQAAEYYRMWATDDAFKGVPIGSPRGTQPKTLFIRRDSVTIPARPFIAPAREKMRANLRQNLEVLLGREMIKLGLR